MGEDYSEALFLSIDTIVAERVRHLPYDRTIIATIINNDDALSGKYEVTTDNNVLFYAYSSNPNYNIKEKVYIRIPEGDYTLQKVIVDKYIAEWDSSLTARNLLYYQDTSITPLVFHTTINTTNYTINLSIDNIYTNEGYIIGFSGIGISLGLTQNTISLDAIEITGYNTINILSSTVALTYINQTFNNNEIQGFSLGGVNPSSITLKGNNLNKIKTITISYGYWLSADNLSTMTVYLYNTKGNLMIYYDPDTTNDLSYILKTKLLRISGNTATPETDYTAFYGGYDDGQLIEGLTYVQALHGEYKLFSDGILTFKPSTLLTKTVLCLAYARTSDNKIFTSNIYALYGRAELGKNSNIFGLELVNVPVFAYDSNKKLLNPIQANETYHCQLTYTNNITGSMIVPSIHINSYKASGIIYNDELNNFEFKVHEKPLNLETGKLELTFTYDSHTYVITATVPFTYSSIDQPNFSITTNGITAGYDNILFNLNTTLLSVGNGLLTSETKKNEQTETIETTLTLGNELVTSGQWAGKSAGLTVNAGSNKLPIYFTNGVPTALSETIGASDLPIYINDGILTASNSTIGSSTSPIYINDGKLTELDKITIDESQYNIVQAINKIIAALNNNVSLINNHTLWQNT